MKDRKSNARPSREQARDRGSARGSFSGSREDRHSGTGSRGQREHAASPAPAARVLESAQLFPLPCSKLRRHMDELLGRALNQACPLKKVHRQELPLNILKLSRLLTVDRAEMRHPYWASPALTGAYVHYFLPWTVYRLSRLFAGLRLPPPPDDGRCLYVDLGSGPLSVPLALWIACPEWRTKKIVVAAVDCAGHPLRLGKAILEALAAEAGVEPWEVRPVQAPLEQGLKKAMHMTGKDLPPWLVTAANVLNELPAPRKNRFDEEDEEETGNDSSRLSGLLALTGQLLEKGPEGARALFVEPGTRLGGLTLMGLRAAASELGLRVLGPCPHEGPCPLSRSDGLDEDEENFFADEEESRPGRTAASSGAGMISKLAGRTWCHFTFTSEGAPLWLRKLAEPTGLAKETLSLACLELALPGSEDQEPEAAGDTTRLRVISQAFPVPGRGLCRYACSGQGLVLLGDARDCESGMELIAGVNAKSLARAPQDARSGARCLALRGAEAERPGERPGERLEQRRAPEGSREGLSASRCQHHGMDRERRERQPGNETDRRPFRDRHVPSGKKRQGQNNPCS